MHEVHESQPSREWRDQASIMGVVLIRLKSDLVGVKKTKLGNVKVVKRKKE